MFRLVVSRSHMRPSLLVIKGVDWYTLLAANRHALFTSELSPSWPQCSTYSFDGNEEVVTILTLTLVNGPSVRMVSVPHLHQPSISSLAWLLCLTGQYLLATWGSKKGLSCRADYCIFEEFKSHLFKTFQGKYYFLPTDFYQYDCKIDVSSNGWHLSHDIHLWLCQTWIQCYGFDNIKTLL